MTTPRLLLALLATTLVLLAGCATPTEESPPGGSSIETPTEQPQIVMLPEKWPQMTLKDHPDPLVDGQLGMVFSLEHRGGDPVDFNEYRVLLDNEEDWIEQVSGTMQTGSKASFKELRDVSRGEHTVSVVHKGSGHSRYLNTVTMN